MQTTLEPTARPTGDDTARHRHPADTGPGGGARPVDVVTFGCRLNTLESEVIRAQAAAAGVEDVVVVNTCAVTAEAVRQARQAIRKARREQPDARIVVTGCAAQIEPGAFAAMTEVDAVLGNAEKLEPGSWQALASGRPPSERVRVGDIFAVRKLAPHMLESFGGRTRAFVEIQTGCDHRCTFCIIPYGRGASRSAPMGAVVEQVRRLVDAGYREVVLTGVDLTSYGADLPASPRLGDLVGRILRLVPELARLRLSSLDAVEIDPALMEAIATEPRLMPHLHLSLQAGDDMILKRMKRRHLREDAIRLCAEVRAVRPDVVFGADLIAGFPTETEAMFDNTLRLVEECGLTYLHVFPFSPREGTPAARMPQLPRAVAKARAAQLRAAGEARLDAFLSSEVGARRAILVEEAGIGRTEGFARAAIDAPVGAIVDARITGREGDRLLAVPHADEAPTPGHAGVVGSGRPDPDRMAAVLDG